VCVDNGNTVTDLTCSDDGPRDVARVLLDFGDGRLTPPQAGMFAWPSNPSQT
jgi:hypothetical protein